MLNHVLVGLKGQEVDGFIVTTFRLLNLTSTSRLVMPRNAAAKMSS